MAKISKLTPVLYKENETDFNHNGLGRLNGLEVYRIEEVLNGEFEALFEYPASGGLAKQIENKMLIKAQPNKKDEPTLFRIYEYELDVATGNYLIYARHKNIDDLGSNLVLDLTVGEATLNQAWNMAKNNAIEPVDISFHSDLLTTSSTIWTRRSLLNCVAGEEGSMIQKWGGEIKHGNNWLWVYRRRGQDNATTVRHGKNLSGLTATYSTKGLTTAIVPYHSYQVENSDEDKVIYGDVVQSQYVNNYPHVYYDAIEYTDEDLGLDSEATETERLNRLNVVAERWFVENTGKDLPSINMVINLEDISQTKEYSKFKDFEQIDLGDTIDVYSEMYKVYVSARIRRVVYNGLTDQNEEVEVGTVSRTIYDDYRELVDERVQEVNKQIQTVQIAANGKNRVFRGPIEPSVGMVKNDIWYKPVGEGEIELYTFDGAYWALEKVSAGLLSGTLDAENGDVNLINVNVANIVGETSEFVRSNWNGINNSILIDTDGLRSTATNGDWTLYHAGAISFGSSVRTGVYLEFADNNRNGVSILNRENISDEISFDLRSDTRNTLNFGMQTDTSGYDFRIDHYQGTKVSFQGRDVKRYTFNLNSDNQMGAISMVAHGNTGYSGGSSYSMGYETADGATKGSRFYFSSASDLVWLSKETYNDLQPLAVYDLQFRWGESGRKSLKDVLDYLSRAAGVDINNIPDVY